jgi:hypothetical protein
MTNVVDVTLTSSGAQVTSYDEINQAVIQAATELSAGVAVDMPAELMSAIAQSTAYGIKQAADYYALATNTFSPYGVNEFMLLAQGAQSGFTLNEFNRTSVVVKFMGVNGVRIPRGSLVGDGTYSYQSSVDGVISGGYVEILCYATNDGSWAVPAATVTTVLTSFDGAYSITCTNLLEGTPAAGIETIPEYRARVLTALRVNTTATVSYLKSLLWALGIPQRLVSIDSNITHVYVDETVDKFNVANAIWQSGVNIAVLAGTTTATIQDYPDSYDIKYTKAAPVEAAIAIVWKSPLTNISNTAVKSSIIAAVMPYVNALAIGYGINGTALTTIIVEAIASIVDKQNVTSLTYTISYSGTPITPTDTLYVLPNPNEYLTILESAITITRD